MSKIKQILLITALSVSALAMPAGANAASYTVEKGDSFFSISNDFGISLSNLQLANNTSGSLIYPGETITIPNEISEADKQLMARLVHAEAKGEPYAGKVAVATVILNRVDDKHFPNTIKAVIYERAGGHYAFTPVKNGAINQPAGAEAMKAVDEAIAFRGQGQGSLYFYNPKISTSDWIFSRTTTVTIGNHRFAK